MPEVIAQEEEHASKTEQENHVQRNTNQRNILLPEILVHVLSYLDAKSLACSALTSRMWARLVNDPTVWENVYLF